MSPAATSRDGVYIRSLEATASLSAPCTSQSPSLSSSSTAQNSPSTPGVLISAASSSSSCSSSGAPRGVRSTGTSCHLGAVLTAAAASSCLRTWATKLLSETTIPTTDFSTSYHPTLNHVVPSLAPPSHSITSSASMPVERGTVAAEALLNAATTNLQFYTSNALDPRALLAVLQAPDWRASLPQDAHETLSRLFCLLEGMNDSSAKSISGHSGLVVANAMHSTGQDAAGGVTARMSTSEISWWRLQAETAPYTGVCVTRSTCGNCNSTRARADYCGIVSVPLNSHSISDALSLEFGGVESVVSDCEACGLTGSIHARSTVLAREPELLVLHVQRGDFIDGSLSVSRNYVMVPTEMTVRTGMNGKKKERYAIVSAVRHHGGPAGRNAHFTAAVRGCAPAASSGIPGILQEPWWIADDDRVYRAPAERALEPSCVYILFYERLAPP